MGIDKFIGDSSTVKPGKGELPKHVRDAIARKKSEKSAAACKGCRDGEYKMKPPSELTRDELQQLAAALAPMIREELAKPEMKNEKPELVIELEDEEAPKEPENGEDDSGEDMGEEDEEPEPLGGDYITTKRFDWSGHCECGCATHTKAAADSVSKAIEAAIRGVVEEWARAALISSIGEMSTADSFTIPDLNKNELRELLRESISEAFRAGAAVELGSPTAPLLPAGGTGTGFTPGAGQVTALSSQAAQDYINQYNYELVNGITDTMVEQMRTEMRAAMEEGNTLQEIQQRLADKVDDVSMTRAEVIARTETARAMQHGQVQQAKELGWAAKTWDVSVNPCGLCEAAADEFEGVDVPIDSTFYNIGDVVTGTDGKVYTIKYPVFVASELHPNCMCRTKRIRVVEAEDEDEEMETEE